MELSEVGRTPSKLDLVENQTNKNMNDRIILAIVLFFGVVAVVAVILAAVAVGRPGGMTGGDTAAQKSAGSAGSSSQPSINVYGSGGSGGPAPASSNRIYTIAMGHDWGAYEYIDNNGYLSGFNKDLIAEVCQAAGMDCRTVWEPYTNCFDSEAGQHPKGGRGLHDRWYDACDGWYVTVNRQAIFKFSSSFLKPYNSQFVVKKGNPSGFDVNNFNTKKIGFIDGWAYDEKCLYRLYSKLLPTGNIMHFNGQPALKDALVAGTIDAAYVGIGDLYKWTDGSGAVLERIGEQKSCMVRGSAMMSRKDSDFPQKWNEGFNKIVSSGQYKKICDAGKETHQHRGDVECL